ncbi:hypothetical protein FB458_2063 [Lapillicoccus jejuensis]|uniref:Uncharacterized protein n=1 Tax=Lapillicoccus jejuensis TaxID=402171 RepID=A0A542E0V4_9MICO|nr:hypothetical protein FB458_2063 [Lapillicoccus jejuensis]
MTPRFRRRLTVGALAVLVLVALVATLWPHPR